jgi:hypothetical protein
VLDGEHGMRWLIIIFLLWMDPVRTCVAFLLPLTLSLGDMLPLSALSSICHIAPKDSTATY